MIDKVQIRNFGTHKKLDIEFGPHVNSIIGRNAEGKSTILRAIKWVILNIPSGDSFINWDAKKASVRICSEDNKITRSKGKGINSYKLNQEEYKAFGNDVPSEIQKALNISTINFQGQHDAPFWFCETAGEVSRQLNSIVNLEIIDKTLGNISSEIHKTRIEIELITDRIKNLQKDESDLSYVPTMDKDLQNLELQESSLLKITRGRALLDEIVKLVVLHITKRENAMAAVLGSKNALSKGAEYKKIKIQVENLSELVETAEKYQKQLEKKPPSFDNITDKKNNWKTLRQEKINLNDIISELLAKTNIITQAKKELEQWKSELEQIAGRNCPLCGAVLKK